MAEKSTLEDKRNHSLRNFKGVNTQAVRQMIDDDEFAWLENVMPIGYGNLKTVMAPSAALTTLPGGKVCYYIQSENIANVNYMFMFCTDGSAYAVNLATNARTTMAAAATFSGAGVRIAQWKNERILIIDPNNGYFDWNGATLTAAKGTILNVIVGFPGTGFTNATTTTLTPSSGSATFTCTLGVNLATLQAAGTGYIVGDVLTVSGGTFTSACTLTVSSVDGSGAITGFNLSTTGIYTIYPGANPVNVTGGHGTAATFNLTFGIYAVTVTNAGSGYGSAPTINVGGAGAGVNAQLTVNLAMNSVGTQIETYAGRVWITNGRTIIFSAPNSYQDFTTASLGGSKIVTDATLHSDILRLIAANDFLYYFGIDSVNVISNVTVTAPVYSGTGSVLSPSVTTFSDVNLVTDMGTDMPDSVVPYHRTLVFATDYGVYGLTGATPQKLSDHLDGVYQNFNNEVIASSAGIVSIFDILCVAFLFQYQDPLTGTTRSLMAIFFNKKWFFSSQVSGMTFIAPALYNDAPVLYGTDGSSLFRLFDNATTAIAQTIKTKLWDMENPLVTKQAFKFGMETVNSDGASTFNINIDTEIKSQAYSSAANNTVTWYNNAGQVAVWKNNSSQIANWLASGYVFSRQDVSAVGNYLGATITSSSPKIVYSGVHLQYQPRTPWASVPW